ncbi:transcriptional regulator, TetR family [Paenibacillus sp. UNCCL117]|uniref:TetR/AcrR family transcriptional regulator n=1 Tax=unclassified Paenibacillus TaxID=185978 RepID=UPI000884DD9D|nr:MULTISPECIES: TetR/AcrR family transcriptional regulator [unclassified Paenibacillus]SDC23845.1 DNA-binding transcriptional regulator, AcrR family [Paenibacillus sp. cl123]SFW19387.1 transcriptional regulator, TetR family [Paenibacillus sp. UNCCL117]
MARNVEKDQELRKERCQQILAAAVELFVKKGVAATKISDIAAKAGISHGLVYNYFRSKEEIYLSLLETNLNSFQWLLDEALAEPLSAYDKLLRVLDRLYAWRWEEAKFHHLFMEQLMMSDSVSEELQQSVQVKSLESLDRVAALFSEAQADGMLREGDPRELAFYLLTLAQASLIAESRGLQFRSEHSPHHVMRFFLKQP